MASVRKSRLSSKNLVKLDRFLDERRADSITLEAIDQSPIRSQAHLFHRILKRDEVLDVEIRFICKVFRGRVQVDVKA